ncbi:MAG TPA: hypothetical protein ENG87_02830 [Candidatus Pacearchaeota archaeon]|nr:hypothetical protein [Candidatus Pacearchaeota archaeon]
MRYIIEYRVKPGRFRGEFKSFEIWRKWKAYATEERMMQAYNCQKWKDEFFEYRIKEVMNDTERKGSTS